MVVQMQIIVVLWQLPSWEEMLYSGLGFLHKDLQVQYLHSMMILNKHYLINLQ